MDCRVASVLNAGVNSSAKRWIQAVSYLTNAKATQGRRRAVEATTLMQHYLFELTSMVTWFARFAVDDLSWFEEFGSPVLAEPFSRVRAHENNKLEEPENEQLQTNPIVFIRTCGQLILSTQSSDVGSN
eukprot:1195398-Prorocentrum_minimum.AAC.4